MIRKIFGSLLGVAFVATLIGTANVPAEAHRYYGYSPYYGGGYYTEYHHHRGSTAAGIVGGVLNGVFGGGSYYYPSARYDYTYREPYYNSYYSSDPYGWY